MNTQLKGLASIEKLLEFRSDAEIELQSPDFDSIFRVSFLDNRPWCPSCTIMEDLGITFTGCGVNEMGHFVLLSTHKQESL